MMYRTSTRKPETVCSSETMIITQKTTRRYNPEENSNLLFFIVNIIIIIIIILLLLLLLLLLLGDPSSSVSIVSGYGPHNRTIEVQSLAEGKGFFVQPLCPHRLWGPPSLLYNGYRGVLSPGVKLGRGMTLTTHTRLVPRYRMSRSYTSSPPQAPS
jgi:predicted nucleic acid-binding Zn ribbon protein